MSATLQLDFLKETTELDFVKAEVSALRASQEKVRKGMFARHNELAKLIMEQQETIEMMREMLGIACRLNKDPNLCQPKCDTILCFSVADK